MKYFRILFSTINQLMANNQSIPTERTAYMYNDINNIYMPFSCYLVYVAFFMSCSHPPVSRRKT